MRSAHEPNTATQFALVASILVGGYFLAFDAGEYLRNFTAAVYGRFWPVRNLMFLHVAAGGLALVAGAIQFGLAFLRRTSTAHRWTGRVYVGAVFVSCIVSLAVISNGSAVGLVWTALLAILAVAAMVYTACGLIAARRREWHRHATWMLRSYMAMMVFAWFRLGWEFPVLEELALRTRAAVILGLTMLITFIATESILALRARTTA